SRVRYYPPAMLTLSLLRHAKSSWADARLKDIDRPLNARGEDAAPLMGAFMAREKLSPDLILCSPAERTRQTLELVLAYLEPAPEVVSEAGLYLASPGGMLKRLRKLARKIRHVMIVGHNPGLHALAQQLVGDEGEAESLEALAAKFPTAGLAVI